MEKEEGPELYTPPVESFLVCNSCKFFDKNLIVTERHHKQYSHVCNNPCIPEDYKSFGFYGNLPQSIRFMVKTPNWCPFLTDENASIPVQSQQ